jgi:aminoglycoside phosphotransferase (APT) family kinase protein
MDEAELTRRVGAVLEADVEPVQRVTSGTSSMVYSTTIKGSGQEIVVKSGVPGLAPVRNRDMLRQARLHRALAATAVPVPLVLAEDPGEPPEVAPFYVMELVPGECVEVTYVEDQTYPPEVVRGRLLGTIRAMAELHNVDPDTVGLGDEPVIELADEVQRWKNSFDACDEDQRANTDDIYEKLMESVPAPIPSRLMHGDFRTGNTLAVEDRITAVIDWEIWSRSDPRIDLAWYLIFVENDRRPSPEGTPSVQELIGQYTDVSGVAVDNLDWFRALVRYKQTAAGAFINRNARRRGAPVELADNIAAPLLVSARHLLGIRSEDPAG